MRWIAVAAIFSLSFGGVNASDSAVSENQTAEALTTIVAADNAVTVTPIPSHAMVVELVKELNPTPELRPAKKLKVAQKKPLPKSFLSRTERHQMALLVAKPKAGEPSLLDILGDEDAGSSAGDLDLQRSFNRPKVAKMAEQDEEDRDQDLSDAVKLRLFLARMRAVKAHEKKFS